MVTKGSYLFKKTILDLTDLCESIDEDLKNRDEIIYRDDGKRCIIQPHYNTYIPLRQEGIDFSKSIYLDFEELEKDKDLEEIKDLIVKYSLASPGKIVPKEIVIKRNKESGLYSLFIPEVFYEDEIFTCNL